MVKIYEAAKVVKQMQDWIGLKKSDGSYQVILDIYNSQKALPRNHKMTNSDAWCAATVSACAIALGYEDIIPPECSCNQMIQLLKNLGEWKEDESVTPEPGWIVFYDWDDTSGNKDNLNKADHVGIVEKVSNGVITVIEGNYSNAVKRRQVAVNGKYLRGYGVPKYTDLSKYETPVKPKDTMPGPPMVKFYVVVKGDTPEKISKAYGITVAQLIAANIDKYPKMTKDYIQIGWRLTIPINDTEVSMPYTAVVTAKSGLNVRKGPSTDSEKKGALKFNTAVTIVGENSTRDWGSIIYNKELGWISLAYVKKV